MATVITESSRIAVTFTFTVRVDDSSGQFTTRQFSLAVAP